MVFPCLHTAPLILLEINRSYEFVKCIYYELHDSNIFPVKTEENFLKIKIIL